MHASLVAALLLVAGLWAIAPKPPDIHPEHAAQHEGRSVHMQGVVTSSQAWHEGGRARLAFNGFAIDMRLPEEVPAAGSWIQAEGPLRRIEGELILFVNHWTLGEHQGKTIPIGLVAAKPTQWLDQDLRLVGELRDDALCDANRCMTLQGEATMAGKVVAAGAITYDATCSCYALQTRSISPWNGSP